jgi:hypothetical protein
VDAPDKPNGYQLWMAAMDLKAKTGRLYNIISESNTKILQHLSPTSYFHAKLKAFGLDCHIKGRNKSSERVHRSSATHPFPFTLLSQ